MFSVAVVLVLVKFLAVLCTGTVRVVRVETGLLVVSPHAMRVHHMLVRRTTTVSPLLVLGTGSTAVTVRLLRLFDVPSRCVLALCLFLGHFWV